MAGLRARRYSVATLFVAIATMIGLLVSAAPASPQADGEPERGQPVVTAPQAPDDSPAAFGDDAPTDRAVPLGRVASPLLSEDFTTFPTTGWSVVNNEPGGPVWTDLAGCLEAGNFTNGAGGVACVSSDKFGVAGYSSPRRASAADTRAANQDTTEDATRCHR